MASHRRGAVSSSRSGPVFVSTWPFGRAANETCAETARHILRRDPRPAERLSCFFIALDRRGRTGGAGTSGGFSYCVTTAEGSRLVDAEVVTS